MIRPYTTDSVLRAFLLLLAALTLSSCAAGMRRQLPGSAVDPAEVIGMIESHNSRLSSDKQIFRVRMLDKGQTFSGDGALAYSAPDTLQLSIYGPPFSTLWMQMLARGDSITVYLPKNDRVVRTSRGDPVEVEKIAASEGLTDAVFMGGVTGSYHIDRFRRPGMRALASREGEISRLRLFDEGEAYEFVYDGGLDAVVRFIHYLDGGMHREIIRSEFRELDGMQRATRTVYRDYSQDREITVNVTKEEINPDLAPGSFEILLPEGT